jgi:hypothetical protein
MKPTSNYVVRFFWKTMDATLTKSAVTWSTLGKILFCSCVNSPLSPTQYYLTHDSIAFRVILIIKPKQIYQNFLFPWATGFLFFVHTKEVIYPAVLCRGIALRWCCRSTVFECWPGNHLFWLLDLTILFIPSEQDPLL